MRLALIEPLGDVGIGTYTYELAEGLVANGVHVDCIRRVSRLSGDCQESTVSSQCSGVHSSAADAARIRDPK